jgi:septum formation protein
MDAPLNQAKLPTLILASASPRRSDLLREIGVPFTVVKADIHEVAPEHLSPVETAEINAYRKARAVAKKHPDTLVLGADTVVSLGTEQFAKPADMADAERMLARLQGRMHLVITGVCLLQLRPYRQRLFAVSTSVTFKKLHIGQIRRYLAKIHPFDKAGSYAIQDEGEMIVKHFKGSYSNVVGLPVERLKAELGRMQAREE